MKSTPSPSPGSLAEILNGTLLMKEPFLMIIFSIFFFSTEAQSDLFGKYKFHAENDETGSLRLNCDNSFQLEDTMVVNKDSSIVSIAKGIWKIRKRRIVELFVDSIISNATATGKLSKVEYNLLDGRLYLKLPSERQYRKDNKKIDKEVGICMPGMWEDYDAYKGKQNKRYFFKIDTFSCLHK